jgi:uncharacterized membrane protein
MTTRKTIFIILIFGALAFSLGIFSYSRFSDAVAVHWGASGEANGFGSRFEGAFLLPIMAIAMSLLLLFIPEIDPLKANIATFRKEYNGFILVFVVFLLYLFVLTVLWNLGVKFKFNQLLVPACGIFFFYLGFLLEKAKRNYFIGIRTPWTLNSDTVWDKTHKVGAVVFKVSGAVALLGIFFPTLALGLLLAPLLLGTLFTVAYSYLEFRRETAVKES